MQSSRWHSTQRWCASDIFTNFNAIGLRIQTFSERDFRFSESYVIAGVTNFFAKQKSRSIESLALHSKIRPEWHFHEFRSIWRLYSHVFWSRNFKIAILCYRLSYSLFRNAKIAFDRAAGTALKDDAQVTFSRISMRLGCVYKRFLDAIFVFQKVML